MQSDSRVFLQHRNLLTYVGMPFIRSTEEEAYASRPALIMRNGLELADAASITQSLEYITFQHPFDSPHLLNTFRYCGKDIQFKQGFRARHQAVFFVNCKSVAIFAIPIWHGEKIFVRMP